MLAAGPRKAEVLLPDGTVTAVPRKRVQVTEPPALGALVGCAGGELLAAALAGDVVQEPARRLLYDRALAFGLSGPSEKRWLARDAALLGVLDQLPGLGLAFGVTDDKHELVKIARRAKQTVESGVVDKGGDRAAQADPEATQLLQQARVKVVPFLDGDEAAGVRAAADALEQAEPDALAAAKARIRDVLAPYSYLF